jgi:hypothetical protein
MAGQDAPRLPKVEPQECRRRAEQCLEDDVSGVDVPRAIGWALLAIAGELHERRKQISRR